VHPSWHPEVRFRKVTLCFDKYADEDVGLRRGFTLGVFLPQQTREQSDRISAMTGGEGNMIGYPSYGDTRLCLVRSQSTYRRRDMDYTHDNGNMCSMFEKKSANFQSDKVICRSHHTGLPYLPQWSPRRKIASLGVFGPQIQTFHLRVSL